MRFLLVLIFLTGCNAGNRAPLLSSGSIQKVPKKYLVKLKDDSNVNGFASRLRSYGRSAFRSGDATILARHKNVIQGIEAKLTRTLIDTVRSMSGVEYVQELSKARLGGSTPMWNLDRIDQDNLPLDRYYNVVDTGSGVNMYVIDTGINPKHLDFENRATIIFDAFGGNGVDCHGHGTHVAGTAGGSVFGVAKDVNLSSMKVFPGCSGETDEGRIISAFDYLVTRVQNPAVVAMSTYVPGGSKYLDDVVRSFIAKTNVTVVACAGNDNSDACLDSPGRLPEVLTVGAVNEHDFRAIFSNYGACTDVFAPGVDILSAAYTGSYNVETLSGTSMACPHVAGAVALLLQHSPDLSTNDTHQMIVDQATPGVIIDPKGANLLLRVNPPNVP